MATSCRFGVQVQTAARIGYRATMVHDVVEGADSVGSGFEKLTDDDPTNKNSGVLDVVLGGTSVFFGVKGLRANIASPKCFPPGTWISTGQGFKSIEQIEVGDVVWAFNVSSGRWELCPVVDTYDWPPTPGISQASCGSGSLDSATAPIVTATAAKHDQQHDDQYQ